MKNILKEKKMKKLLILLIVMSLSVLALSSCDAITDILAGLGSGSGSGNPGGGGGNQVDDTKKTDGLTFELMEDGSYTVSGYTGTDTEVFIPSVYEGIAVTSIKGNSFKNKGTITAVNIPSSVTEIGAKAFENCSYLATVKYYSEPTSLVIGASAFSGCSSLSSFSLPSTTVEIASRAFGGCNKLTYVDGGCTYVGSWLILCDISATSATIKNNTVGIANSAFSGGSLATVTIPSTVKYVGDAAFMRCASLFEVKADASAIVSIGDEAFAECSSLSRVQLPATVSSIGEKVFTSCPMLSSITVPDGCAAYSSANNTCLIDKTAKTLIFACHTATISIPNDGSVEVIGDYAFHKNEKIALISLPASVKEIGVHAFSYASNLTSFTVANNSLLDSIGAYAFSESGCASIDFGANSKFRSIGENAFSSACRLNRIVIPASVETIGKSAFSNDWVWLQLPLKRVASSRELRLKPLWAAPRSRISLYPKALNTSATRHSTDAITLPTYTFPQALLTLAHSASMLQST